MARPKVPLIAKRKALEVALDIVDNEGIDSLSIRRLAERLNVNGASLYHHFENKEEIAVGAAKLALEDVRRPQTHDEPWQVWIMRNARRLRRPRVARSGWTCPGSPPRRTCVPCPVRPRNQGVSRQEEGPLHHSPRQPLPRSRPR